MKIKGRVWVYPDNVDTDVIIPARYLNTSDPAELAKHCMEDIDENFAKEVKEGDIIVAGYNFGSGSSREHAPIAIKASGVSCVIAKSFSRIFYRNAFNIGLPILESNVVDELEKGDEIEVDTSEGKIMVLKNGKVFKSSVIPEFMQQLIESGGLFGYAKKLLNV
ncbi:3-isopropylmalate dehydratase small subunit [Hippea maritima]|uniref:3-isopropylmalate dehydratase small subunit n=1 Tax=Hippea maritima (strain ATCC 700847 / DSM 10411 / MH2) TaxID=760142 RepID=F2LU24_HIPMA|nr:3-isopropylmalate dehydratase small subunit [Hippea maritima]AEA33423.1 3-isopropylmalate dehydratase small subunit [Hippea maritima DSM 10411]